MTTTDESVAIMNACSDAITKAVTPLLMEYDTRMLFACLAAEVAYIGATLRTAGVYQPGTVARVFAEAMATALTLDTKMPKLMYTDGSQTMGSKQ
jgi:hypothetical protein